MNDPMREALAVVCRDLRGEKSRTQIAAKIDRGEQATEYRKQFGQ